MLSVSCTTRPPRSGEKEGVDYHFMDEKTFRDKVRQDLFFEWEEVHGLYYGTPKEPVLQRRAEGLDTIFDVDVRGAVNLKKAYPDTCTMFLIPPSLEALEARLRSRQTEEESSIQRRLTDARREMQEKDQFDYVIINDEIERSYKELKSIVVKEQKIRDSSPRHSG